MKDEPELELFVKLKYANETVHEFYYFIQSLPEDFLTDGWRLFIGQGSGKAYDNCALLRIIDGETIAYNSLRVRAQWIIYEQEHELTNI